MERTGSEKLKRFIVQNRALAGYIMLFPLLVFLLKWLQWKFLILDQSAELYGGVIALFFTVFGIWIAMQLTSAGKPLVAENTVAATVERQANHQALESLNFSRREKEVFELLMKGHSNAEIANVLFLSLSTVKTHVSNILLKMDVPSRTKAIEKARQLSINT